MKLTLYGSAESEPVAEACKKLTEEFFKEDTLRLLIICLPRLNLEVGFESCIFFNWMSIYVGYKFVAFFII